MYRRLVWLSVGAFAVGTEGFVIAGILPAVARDLNVGLATAGHLVTIFAFTYAIATPILAALTAGWRRERILRIGMAGFVAGNLAAVLAPTFAWLAAARCVIALFAGLFMATASAYAAASVEPSKRGRALAFVYMGMTVATVLGVPVGTLIGAAFGWRATFVAVAVLGLVAFAGAWLPRPAQALQPGASLRERIRIGMRPEILLGLLTTALVFAGAFSVYTYLAPLLRKVGALGDREIAMVLMLFGLGGALGNLVGGHLADRLGARRVLVWAMSGLSVLFASLATAASTLTPPLSTLAVISIVALWGVVGWSFPPAQQLNFVQRAPNAVPVVLSLNASAMYFGISFGAALGSAIISISAVNCIGWAAALCLLGALGVASLTRSRALLLSIQP